MAKLVLPFLFLTLFANNPYALMQDAGKEDVLTIANFEKVKRFVLQYGNKKTYCNRYNCNPHFDFDDFEVYLNPNDSFTHSGYAGLGKEARFYNRITIAIDRKYIDIKEQTIDATLQVSANISSEVRQQAIACFITMLDVAQRLDTALISKNKNATGFMYCKESE